MRCVLPWHMVLYKRFLKVKLEYFRTFFLCQYQYPHVKCKWKKFDFLQLCVWERECVRVSQRTHTFLNKINLFLMLSVLFSTSMQLLKLHLRPVHKLTEAHFCPSHYAWETVLQTVAQAPQRVKVADSASER